MKEDGDDQRSGVQSIEVGMQLLVALTGMQEAATLTALAARAEMSPSKAHKYLISFSRVGLVRQNIATGRYDLGPFAIELGLAAMGRLDLVERAYPAMVALVERLNETLSLTVWGGRGATIVRVVEALRPVAVTVRLGATLDLLTSSNGRVFLAWLDRGLTEAAIRAELADPTGAAAVAGIARQDQVDRLAQAIRDRGLAEVQGLVVPGIVGLSAPIFGPAGLAAGLTVIGTVGGIDTADGGPVATALRAAAREITRELGGTTFLDE